jgi:hypothetical protein
MPALLPNFELQVFRGVSRKCFHTARFIRNQKT